MSFIVIALMFMAVAAMVKKVDQDRQRQTLFYSDASNPSRPLPLRLESGDQRSLRIELEPEENGSATHR